MIQGSTGFSGHNGPPALAGIFPLVFFLAHLSTHFADGAPENMLWLCNLSNLILALGIFFQVPVLIRVSTLWLIPGVPLWLYDMTQTGFTPISTFVSHLGGVTVGLFALSRLKPDQKMWIYAWIYGLIVQLCCRLFTRPELNINVAFHTYSPLEGFFAEYWRYWIFNAIVAAVGLWLITITCNTLLSRAEGREIPMPAKAVAPIKDETARNY